MMFDPLYLVLALPGLLLGFYAQFKVKRTFERFAQVALARGYTGAQIAEAILRTEGITGVRIEPSDGFLSDHYDPSARALRLSPDVFHGRSVSAAGVAAHEVGHAIQHARAYPMLGLRSAIVPVLGITSKLAMPAIMVGFFLASMGRTGFGPQLVLLGIGLFAVTVFFQLVTLPVEFDASRRALLAIEHGGLVTRSELDGARSVLSAAALTYVAAAVASLLQLLYFVLRYSAMRGRDQE